MFKNTFVCLRVCQAEGTGFAISSDRVAAPDEPSDSAGQVTGLAPPPRTHTHSSTPGHTALPGRLSEAPASRDWAPAGPTSPLRL